VPNAPTSVRAVADNTTGIDVSWTAPAFNGGSAITDYVVEYATDNSDYVVFADGVSTGTSVKVTGLTQGVEYTFRIAAKNIAGQGAYSAQTVYAKATARTVPGAPTATAKSTRDGAIELEWNFIGGQTNGGDDIIRYDVEWARVGTSTWSSAPYTERTTRIENLTIGTQYKFRTTASNAAGTGSYSAEVFAVPQVPPNSVTELVGDSDNGNVTLSWKAPVFTGGAPLTKYYLAFCNALEVCKTKATITPVRGVLPTQTTFLSIPGTFRFYVGAVNDAGLEECADPKQIKCGTSVTVVVGSGVNIEKSD
jgi:titin